MTDETENKIEIPYTAKQAIAVINMIGAKEVELEIDPQTQKQRVRIVMHETHEFNVDMNVNRGDSDADAVTKRMLDDNSSEFKAAATGGGDAQ